MAYGAVFYWLFLCLVWAFIIAHLLDRRGGVSPTAGMVPDRTPLLLALAILAAKWPIIFFNAELNADESQFFAGALGLLHDPVPWRGADNTTSGPLNSY